MDLEHSVEIQAPADRIWQVTVDVETWPQWSPAMERIQREDSGDFRLGSSALIKQKMMPATRWTVTELIPGQRFSWESRAMGMDMLATHILQPGETGVTSILQVKMTGFMASLLGPLIKPLVWHSLKAENRGLKQFCEGLTHPD